MNRSLSSPLQSSSTSLSQTRITLIPWIKQLCHAQPLLIEIDKSYIEDSFNLYGLKQLVQDYNNAMNIILDKKATETYSRDMIQSAMLLYGLIHARYICTLRGLELMKRKYLEGFFGVCPRHLCNSQNVVPIGLTEQPNLDVIKFFCPSCQDVYCYPAGKYSLDSAYIGPHFPHMFFMTYDNLVPKNSPEIYRPKIFGFKVHHSSSSLCQYPPKRMTLPDESQTSTNPPPVQNFNGRRSSLPFLDEENEDESDGEVSAPTYQPTRLFSPVTLSSPPYGAYNYPHFKQLQQQQHLQMQLQSHHHHQQQLHLHQQQQLQQQLQQHHQYQYQQPQLQRHQQPQLQLPQHLQQQQQQQQQSPHRSQPQSYPTNISLSNSLPNSPTIEYSNSFLRGIKRDSNGGELSHVYYDKNLLSQSTIPLTSSTSSSCSSSSSYSSSSISSTSTTANSSLSSIPIANVQSNDK